MTFLEFYFLGMVLSFVLLLVELADSYNKGELCENTPGLFASGVLGSWITVITIFLKWCKDTYNNNN